MNKREKIIKCVSIILTALFIYSSIGYLVLYFPARTVIKYFVQKSLQDNEIEKDRLCTLVFNINELKANKYDFIWEKPDKEFRFEGKMYDIENIEFKGDRIIYTCFYDHKENILEEFFALQFSDHKKDKTQNYFQRLVLAGIYSEEINNLNTNFDNQTVSNIPLQTTDAGLLNYISEVPNPPPRIIV